MIKAARKRFKVQQLRGVNTIEPHPGFKLTMIISSVINITLPAHLKNGNSLRKH